MHSSDTSSQLQHDKKDPSMDASHPSLNPAEKGLYIRGPLRSQKRVDAFSANQEQQIKDLFEEFKDHKRCSYMIANALDSAGSISTSQVSRKLKQLGLVRPKQKNARASMQLRDEIESEIPSEGAGNSDGETLSSLRIRGKHKRKGSHYDQINNKKVAQKLPEDISDDELLSSVLVKTKKKMLSSNDDEGMADVFRENISETNFTGMDFQVTESSRDEVVQSKQMNSQETDAAVPSDSSDIATEKIGEGNLNILGSKTYEETENSQHPLDDELADFDEDTEPVNISQENSAVRRQRRMVIDFEDDEE